MTGLSRGGRDPLVKSPDLTAIPVTLTLYVNWLLVTLPEHSTKSRYQRSIPNHLTRAPYLITLPELFLPNYPTGALPT
eukprot:120455-Chlamydomonas_euryale.AAC.2